MEHSHLYPSISGPERVQKHVSAKNLNTWSRWGQVCRVGIAVGCMCGLWAGAVLAGEQPQELPRAVLKTTPPLFKEWNFNQGPLDATPTGFSLEKVEGKGNGEWVVQKDDSAPSGPNLVQQKLSCEGGECYQVMLAEDVTVEYVDLSVRMKMLLGTPEGKGGLVFGAQDSRNFYAIVAEPKSNEVIAYLVQDGQFKELGREPLKLTPMEWHFLRLQRNTIISKEFTEIHFDHHMLLAVYDQTFRKGKVGLIAIGNGGFAFDNLRAMELLTSRPLSRPAAY